jgi:hypothetical protein
MNALNLIAASVTFVLIVGIYMYKQRRLADVSDERYLPLNEVASRMKLLPGPVEVVLLRQSGAVHRNLGLLPRPEDALALVFEPFAKAKIDAVFLSENSTERLHIERLHRNHRGAGSGKRLGGALFVSRADQTAVKVAPIPTPQVEEIALPPGTGIAKIPDGYSNKIVCGYCGGEPETRPGKDGVSEVFCIECGSIARMEDVQVSLANFIRSLEGPRFGADVGETPFVLEAISKD